VKFGEFEPGKVVIFSHSARLDLATEEHKRN